MMKHIKQLLLDLNDEGVDLRELRCCKDCPTYEAVVQRLKTRSCRYKNNAKTRAKISFYYRIHISKELKRANTPIRREENTKIDEQYLSDEQHLNDEKYLQDENQVHNEEELHCGLHDVLAEHSYSTNNVKTEHDRQNNDISDVMEEKNVEECLEMYLVGLS